MSKPVRVRKYCRCGKYSYKHADSKRKSSIWFSCIGCLTSNEFDLIGYKSKNDLKKKISKMAKRVKNPKSEDDLVAMTEELKNSFLFLKDVTRIAI